MLNPDSMSLRTSSRSLEAAAAVSLAHTYFARGAAKAMLQHLEHNRDSARWLALEMTWDCTPAKVNFGGSLCNR
jgi:hypothetical protein